MSTAREVRRYDHGPSFIFPSIANTFFISGFTKNMDALPVTPKTVHTRAISRHQPPDQRGGRGDSDVQRLHQLEEEEEEDDDEEEKDEPGTDGDVTRSDVVDSVSFCSDCCGLDDEDGGCDVENGRER